MVETVDAGTAPVKRPGIVMLAAVLDFLGAASFLIIAFFSLLVVIFGSTFQLTQEMAQQVTEATQTANVSLSVTAIFAFVLVVCLVFGLAFLFLGIGLLKGQKWTWFVQLALSIIGVFGFPIGTILHGIILVFFFQRQTREFFKV